VPLAHSVRAFIRAKHGENTFPKRYREVKPPQRRFPRRFRNSFSRHHLRQWSGPGSNRLPPACKAQRCAFRQVHLYLLLCSTVRNVLICAPIRYRRLLRICCPPRPVVCRTLLLRICCPPLPNRRETLFPVCRPPRPVVCRSLFLIYRAAPISRISCLQAREGTPACCLP
jgi:hypothetical protein